jgi:acetolactate synthase-1/3 small subunit
MQHSDCAKCGKCAPSIPETITRKEGDVLYSFLIYSENITGLLSLITAVFTRRQVNIESLNVCASSTPGVHKYTITCYCDEAMAQMLTKQIEKKIDVIQANYFTDDEIFILETALFKISTPLMLENNKVGKIVRSHSAKIVEVNPTYATIEKTGITEDILSLYHRLQEQGVILQFVRSGRICITKSYTEKLDVFLLEREKKRCEQLNGIK